MTQPRPEPFGQVALSLARLHNNSHGKWFIATVCTLQSAFPPLHQHISQYCEVEGKWLRICFWQYLWEMTIVSLSITSLFLSWAPPPPIWPLEALNRGEERRDEQLQSVLQRHFQGVKQMFNQCSYRFQASLRDKYGWKQPDCRQDDWLDGRRRKYGEHCLWIYVFLYLFIS